MVDLGGIKRNKGQLTLVAAVHLALLKRLKTHLGFVSSVLLVFGLFFALVRMEGKIMVYRAERH